MPSRRETAVYTCVGWTAATALASVALGASWQLGAPVAALALLGLASLYAAVNVAADTLYLSTVVRDAWQDTADERIAAAVRDLHAAELHEVAQTVEHYWEAREEAEIA